MTDNINPKENNMTMITYTSEHIKLIHRAGEMKIPLELALQMIDLLGGIEPTPMPRVHHFSGEPKNGNGDEGTVREAILGCLARRGRQGATAKEIQEETGKKRHNIHSWFSSNAGKEMRRSGKLKRKAGGLWVLRASAARELA